MGDAQWPRIVLEHEIKDYMSRFIKGQDKILDLYAFIGYSYTTQLSAQILGIRKQSLPKMNILVTGPTGSSKTFAAQKFAEALGMPYTKIDCSITVGEGWLGTSTSAYLSEFLEKSPNGYGILHLDEIDKIAWGDGDDYRGQIARQTSLLELLDGTYNILYGPNKTSLNNINNSLIILSGSFQQHRDNIDSMNSRNIGFINSKEKSEDILDWKNKIHTLGFSKEFAARIVHTIEVEKYNKEQIKDIIIFGEESPYRKYLNLFGEDATLTIDDINEIVDKTVNSKNGLRELDSLFFQKFYSKRRKY